MNYVTLKFRVKDASDRAQLNSYARSVNYVWNYCKEMTIKANGQNGRWLTDYDLQRLVSGTSIALGISSQSINKTCTEYVNKRKQQKKLKLKWRSRKSLGWIPLTKQDITKLQDGKFNYYGRTYRFWQTQPIGKIKMGSFNQDTQGRWYVNFICEDSRPAYKNTGVEVGVDLGLKTTATYSDGSTFEAIRTTGKYADKLAMAQRSRKKKRVAAIQAKIKNTRKDAIHKETTRAVRQYDKIFVGDVSSTKLIKTKMAKSVLDAGWGMYRSFLEYKAIRLGKEVVNVKENYSTVTCSNCHEKTGPSGLSALGVREWACKCGTVHNRDANAAKNILRFGHETQKVEAGRNDGRCQPSLFRYPPNKGKDSL